MSSRNVKSIAKKDPAKKRENTNILESLGSSKILAILLAVAVVLAILGGLYYSGHLFPNTSGSNTSLSLPASITTGYFHKVTNSDYASSNEVNVYFLSWKGCPIGAADSLFIYETFVRYNNSVATDIQYHTSDPFDEYPNTPGLLFSDFSIKSKNLTYTFNVAYVYGETLPDNNSLISDGLSSLKSDFPSSIYTIFLDYQTKVPVQGQNGSIAAIGNHLTSSIVVTGLNGTYYLEGPVNGFGPQDLVGYRNSTQVLNAVGSIQPLVVASEYFQRVLRETAS